MNLFILHFITIDDNTELSLSLGDFIILELLRAKKIERSEIDFIKEIFYRLDEDHSGLLDERDLKKLSIKSYHDYGSITSV